MVDNVLKKSKRKQLTSYVTHSLGFEYESELYLPLKESALWSKYKIILPYDGQTKPKDSTQWLEEADIVLAEVSVSSTGQGIELGWASKSEKRIIAFYKQGSNPSRSLKFVTSEMFEYRDSIDLIEKLGGVLKNED